MFFIILGIIILSSIITTIKFPNLIAPLTSKLPKFQFSKWFSNPRIKTLLQDREFFNENISKILKGSLFIVLGNENYKIFDMIAPPDSYGIAESLEKSEEAFGILDHQGTKFLFVHPSLVTQEKDNQFNTRTRLLINRICKLRKQRYIDGIIIIPNSLSLKKSDLPTSKELANEINFCINVFQIFSNVLKVRLPLYFIPNDNTTDKQEVLKNIFKHDPLTGNDNLYLGFSCDFTKKPSEEKLYTYFQNTMTSFEKAFNAKTQSILQSSSHNANGFSAVNSAYNVQNENFCLSKNYISFLLNDLEASNEAELSYVAILYPCLFASFEGSIFAESVKNIFEYLAKHGKDKVLWSTKLLNYRRRLNIMLSAWTVLFAIVGLLSGWKANQFLFEKKIAYINSSIAEYQKFAQMFNDVLANKFPFASSTVLQNADYSAIAYVFQAFQNLLKDKRVYFFNHLSLLTQRTDIEKFIEQMKIVSNFLHLQTDEKDSSSSTYNLGVSFDFRVRLQDEFLGNRILDWSISIGKQIYGSKYGAPRHVEFLWTYGEPLIFKVEFYGREHKNYDPLLVPKKPIENKSQIQSNKYMYIQGESVVFSYPNDAWSLLRFIEDHDICSSTKIPCSQSVLQFIIPLANQSNAVFFCNLALQDIDGKNLTIPVFPTIAPLFKK